MLFVEANGVPFHNIVANGGTPNGDWKAYDTATHNDILQAHRSTSAIAMSKNGAGNRTRTTSDAWTIDNLKEWAEDFAQNHPTYDLAACEEG